MRSKKQGRYFKSHFYVGTEIPGPRVLQTTQMNLVVFSVWADWAVLGRTETSQQKLKCATFEGVFFMFSRSKK